MPHAFEFRSFEEFSKIIPCKILFEKNQQHITITLYASSEALMNLSKSRLFCNIFFEIYHNIIRWHYNMWNADISLSKNIVLKRAAITGIFSMYTCISMCGLEKYLPILHVPY